MADSVSDRYANQREGVVPLCYHGSLALHRHGKYWTVQTYVERLARQMSPLRKVIPLWIPLYLAAQSSYIVCETVGEGSMGGQKDKYLLASETPLENPKTSRCLRKSLTGLQPRSYTLPIHRDLNSSRAWRQAWLWSPHVATCA